MIEEHEDFELNEADFEIDNEEELDKVDWNNDLNLTSHSTTRTIKKLLRSIRGEDEEPQVKEEEEEAQPKKEKDFIQWVLKGENSYVPSGVVKLKNNVTPGVYKVLYTREWGHYLAKREISLDELLILPQPEQGMILDDIRKFWDRKEIFEKYKYNYKRGILLYGPPGNGKSSIIHLLSDEIIKKHNGIVFFLNTPAELENFTEFIQTAFRQIEPNTPILCVLEDLETLTKHHETETLLLNTLDGAGQMENIVYLACTNYPEELKERILNRPNRFDRRYEIKHPSFEVRKFYFEKKLKDDDLKVIDVDYWAKQTDGFSIAHLGEVIKSVCVLGNTFEETIETLSAMKQKISSFDFGKENSKVGFGKR